MSLQTLSEWLRCPICLQPLSRREPLALVCPDGHAFDVNKRGFVSLIGGSRNLRADSNEMLNARDQFLGGGWYSELRDALGQAVAFEAPERILDVGCGTGYYLDGVLERSGARAALGMDLSPSAVARTVRTVRSRHPSVSVDGLVADVWSPLPIRDSAADVILNVFAPRNAAEFHRVLRADGLLAVVVPQDAHLRELRTAGLVLDVQADKTALLAESLAGFFSLESLGSISTIMSLTLADVAAVVGMGPSAHHGGPEPIDAHGSADGSGAPDEARELVTAAFELLLFRRLSR
jgi:SAM-dependent methyltransferase